MVIIDFSEASKQAFVRGFSKGIAAPVMLFGSFTAPLLPEVEQVAYPSISMDRLLRATGRK